ncbi:MAG: xenobiotic compound monooxygenase subunit [Glaciihabitans sp.]|nr:xenobiotic compound monooxygenase subunit [Glaciihabitans sp.]
MTEQATTDQSAPDETPATGWYERDGQIVLGAVIRSLGAFSSGWRYPGAHRDPAEDPKALKRVAIEAEKHGLDYLFLGDWLSTHAELEYSDPYLIARLDPFSAAGYLAAVTKRIGIVATASVVHSDPFSVARAAASIDHLSGGRFGLNLTVGTDLFAASNFGRSTPINDERPFGTAEEFVAVLRGLWDTFPADAFKGDAETGRLLDRSRISRLDHVGHDYAVAGPLNALRPVQGHVPLMHAGMSPNSREFAAALADIHVIAPSSLGDSVQQYRLVKARVVELGRRPDELSIVTPILPIVAATREEAWQVYDDLVALVQLEDAATEPGGPRLPNQRRIDDLMRLVGLPLVRPRLEQVVSAESAARLNAVGQRLLEIVRVRSGRIVGSTRPVTWRHLLVAHLPGSPIIVGSAADVADHLEEWFRASAVDGFHVLSAFLHEQFEAFTRLVVPELRSRGLVRGRYASSTLRGHLGAPARPLPLPPTESCLT